MVPSSVLWRLSVRCNLETVLLRSRASTAGKTGGDGRGVANEPAPAPFHVVAWPEQDQERKPLLSKFPRC